MTHRMITMLDICRAGRGEDDAASQLYANLEKREVREIVWKLRK